MFHQSISALKVSTVAPACIIPSFCLSLSFLRSTLHPVFCLASHQLQSSFQYPSPNVHFPLSIIIPSQSSLFGLHLSSIGAFLKAFISWPGLKDTGSITSITSCIFLTLILLFNISLPVSTFCLNKQLSASIPLRSALVPKHEQAG